LGVAEDVTIPALDKPVMVPPDTTIAPVTVTVAEDVIAPARVDVIKTLLLIV
jgi:hypothetical protein